MKTYIVNVREVHIRPVKVEAPNEVEAIDAVYRGGGEDYPDDLPDKYSHTLDTDTWTVEKINRNKQ